MALSAKTIRTQLNLLLPLLHSCSLDTLRKGQNRVGELMEAKYRRDIYCREHPFDDFDAAWIMPKDERRQDVVLYLHGGGYRLLSQNSKVLKYRPSLWYNIEQLFGKEGLYVSGVISKIPAPDI